LPKNNPSIHVACALARRLGACGLFRCNSLTEVFGIYETVDQAIAARKGEHR